MWATRASQGRHPAPLKIWRKLWKMIQFMCDACYIFEWGTQKSRKESHLCCISILQRLQELHKHHLGRLMGDLCQLPNHAGVQRQYTGMNRVPMGGHLGILWAFVSTNVRTPWPCRMAFMSCAWHLSKIRDARSHSFASFPITTEILKQQWLRGNPRPSSRSKAHFPSDRWPVRTCIEFYERSWTFFIIKSEYIVVLLGDFNWETL